MGATKTSLSGRASFDRRAWADAFDALVAAEAEGPLHREDLERLVWSAGLRGNDDAFLGALERLYNACVEANDPRAAARAAFWIGFRLDLIASAASSGWLGRASRHLEGEPACAERGYLLLPKAIGHLMSGELPTAEQTSREAARIGEECRDRDLVALARQVEGKALLAQHRIEAGLALLDEVMIAATSNELSPLVTGIIYCNSIAYCQDVYALDRAREWTAALTRWCNEQPQLVTFTGICLVHRAELMQLGGDWGAAIEAVESLVERTSNADPEVYGDACYQRAELHRLRGEFDLAESDYRLASEGGREPQPGLALLRLAQGQLDAAASTMRRLLVTTTAKNKRARLLPAFVEIMIAVNGVDEATSAANELEEIARVLGSEVLHAMAAHARGAVLVAKGDARGSIEPLRLAFAFWNKAGAPYIAARIRVLLARAFVVLGDQDSASLERAAARKVFEELGAVHDLDEPSKSKSSHGLSPRELEVLRLLASGKTNKAIGKELFVSERTIDRHVSNIFLKLGVATRAAATAFAYEHELVT